MRTPIGKTLHSSGFSDASSIGRQHSFLKDQSQFSFKHLHGELYRFIQSAARNPTMQERADFPFHVSAKAFVRHVRNEEANNRQRAHVQVCYPARKLLNIL